MKTSFQAGASRFAHFAGLSRGARAEDDKPEDDTDGKGAKASEDGEDDPEKDDSKAKKGKKARAEDDDPDGDGDDDRGAKASEDGEDDPEKDDPKAKKGKKARAEDDDPDGEEDDNKDEMTGKSAAANARRRERARCAAIFAAPSAANNIPLAASLAFETTMTRSEAIAVMKGQAGRTTAPTRSPRESRNADLSTTDGPGASKPKAGASWDRSFKKIGVATRG